MNIVWTDNATAQLRAIHDYIAQDSQRYALAMIDRLTSRSQQIARYPQSGSVVTEFDHPDIREIIEGPYRIIYRVKTEHVEVLSVIHGARQLPRNIS